MAITGHMMGAGIPNTSHSTAVQPGSSRTLRRGGGVQGKKKKCNRVAHGGTKTNVNSEWTTRDERHDKSHRKKNKKLKGGKGRYKEVGNPVEEWREREDL